MKNPDMRKIPSYMRNSFRLKTPRDRSSTIPHEFLLRDLKEKRKFRFLARKLTLFVSFVAVYVAVLLIDRDISGRKCFFLSFLFSHQKRCLH